MISLISRSRDNSLQLMIIKDLVAEGHERSSNLAEAVSKLLLINLKNNKTRKIIYKVLLRKKNKQPRERNKLRLSAH